MAENKGWFAVITYSGYENKVTNSIMQQAENRNMLDQILDVVIPMEVENEEELKKDRETDDIIPVDEKKDNEKKRKLFPGYIFVKVALESDGQGGRKISDETFQLIRKTRGVSGFAASDGNHPIPLSPVEVEKAHLGGMVAAKKVDFAVGDIVLIKDGPFADNMGPVDEIDLENETVRVLISLMGRDTPYETSLDSVEPV